MKKIHTPLILLILLFLPVGIFSQVKIKEPLTPSFASITGSAQITNNNTLNFTVPPGNSRLLLVFATDEDATSIASVSFDGQALTRQTEGTDGVAVDSVWTLTLGTSATGTTDNIVVVSTGATPNQSIFIGAVALVSVDQTTPVEGIQQGLVIAGDSSASSFNITSETGDLVFDYLDAYEDLPMGPETQTPGMGQTQLHNADDVALMGGGPDRGYFQSSWRPGGAPNVPMAWTTTNDAIQHIAFNINGIGPTAAQFTIGGRVLTAAGRGIPNALITASDQNGNIRLTRSNSFGYYRFGDVQSGQTYILSVAGKGLTFANPTQLVTVKDDLTSLDFLALP